jgi:putative MATE family efflux protein
MSGPPHKQFDRSFIEGPIGPAVWRLAWPAMVQNLIGGMQGLVDHAMVGHYQGYAANAGLGVSWQIFLVVIVFISSLFTGQAILVARYAGAGNHDQVNRVVYQAFLTAVFLAVGVLAPLGYVLSPHLLDLVNAAPDVREHALPFLRTIFTFNIGMMLFFMLSAALRAAGDARTPLQLGVIMTVLNVLLNVALIPGLGPIPALGTMGAALGTSISGGVVGIYGVWKLFSGHTVIRFSRQMALRPDLAVIRLLFQFGLPTGVQGVAMNVGGVWLLRFIGSLTESAAAQAAFAVAYTELFSFITWTSVGLMGATSVIVGQNIGAHRPDRAKAAVRTSARLGLLVASTLGVLFLVIPQALLSLFGMTEGRPAELGVLLLRVLSVSGLFVTLALTYTGGLQGSGDTKSPLFISIVSQVVIPLGACATLQAMGRLTPMAIWLAILAGHSTRALLSYWRFRQGAWQQIAVDLDHRPSKPPRL